MSGRKGVSPGKRLLDQPEHRLLYLAKVREGYGRYEAAQLVGMDYTTVWRYIRDNPDFVAELQDAEANSVESVHKLYREVMSDSEAQTKDRLAAAEKLERALGRYHKNDVRHVEHSHKVAIEVGGNMVEEVIAIRNRLALERGEAIDVESEEL